jgi:DNA-binding MarR family transcriptional regulator
MAGITKQDYMLAWVSLVHAGNYLASALSNHFQASLDISLVEQDLLSQLDKAGGEVKMVELARRTFVSKAGMTKMIDRLEASGLVVRVSYEGDRRVTSAKLTGEGERLLQRSRKMLGDWVKANVRGHLSDDQVLALGDALKSLLEGHGRWEGQLAHLRGYPSPSQDGPPAAKRGGG